MKLQRKLLLVLTVIIVVLVVILSVFFYNYLYNDLVAKESTTSQRISEKTSSQIDELYKQMDMGALFIVKNAVIEDALTGLQKSQNSKDYWKIKYESQINSQLNILSYYFPNMVNSVIFDGKSGFYYHSGLPDERSEVQKRLNTSGWYEGLIPGDKQLQILPPHQDFWNSMTRPVISIARRLMTPGKKELGLLVIDIPYWNLKNICQTNILSEDSMILLFDNTGNLVYPFTSEDVNTNLFDAGMPGEIYGKIAGKTEFSSQYTSSRYKFYYSAKKSNFTGFTTVLITEQSTLQNKMYTYILFILLAGAIIIAAVLLVYFILIRHMTKPLRQLSLTIGDVSLDNLNLEIPHGGQDELKMLNASFNAMFSKLKDSINQVYESRLREINSSFLALQAQINPHFLYNTLGVISASSEQYGNIETASMCNKLSEMMRYIVSRSDSLVTLREELTHALNYLNLMESHYIDYKNDRKSFVTYEVDIPEEMLPLPVPKMILQPLVENCFNHGFDNTLPPWEIHIKGVMTDAANWTITVRDNGVGVDGHALEQINGQIKEYYCNIRNGEFHQNLNIGGMGILNTYARLVIIFKDSTLFHIGNNPGKGCTITFGTQSQEV